MSTYPDTMNMPKISSFMQFHNAGQRAEILQLLSSRNILYATVASLPVGTFDSNLDDLRCSEENFGIIKITVDEMPIQKHTWDILFSIDISASMSERCRDGKSKLHHIKHTMSNILRLFSKNTEAIFNVCVHAFNHKHKEIFDFVEITTENVEKYIQFIQYIQADGSTDLLIPLEMCEKKYEERQETHPDNKFVHIELTDGEDTSCNTNQTLVSHVTDNYKNIFIGFGVNHNSELLEMFTTNSNNEYRFIDKIDNSGYVYGEIIHNLLYTFVDNGCISVLNGLIYDWKTNEWTHSIDIGSIATGSTKTFHIKTTTPNLMTGKLCDNFGVFCAGSQNHHSTLDFATQNRCCNIKKVLSYIEILPDLVDISGNLHETDLTKYMFRQKVQELLFEAKTPDNIQAFKIKKILKEFFLSMKSYIEANQLNDDIFWKVMLDDIYIVYKTIGKPYSHMYTTTRQVSQGREYSCNTEDITDDYTENNTPLIRSRNNNPLIRSRNNNWTILDANTPFPEHCNKTMHPITNVIHTDTQNYNDIRFNSLSRNIDNEYNDDTWVNRWSSRHDNNDNDNDDIDNDDIDNDIDDDDEIMNHQVTLTRETTTHSTQQMNDIIDFIRNQDV